MFDGRGTVELIEDHVDLSYPEPTSWLTLTPTESIRSAMMFLGDPDTGPSLTLARITQVAGENLDWKHTIDPVHHHGTDAFRLILGGEWKVGQHPLSAGSFSFQEAGRVYQEHPGDSHHSWLLLAYGDRRGEPATIIRADDREKFEGDAEIYGASIASDDYPHPAGPKGLPAVLTSGGPAFRGYFAGSFAESSQWPRNALGRPQFVGVWGDAASGPAVYLTTAAAGQSVLPACGAPTEVLLAVVTGSCRVGSDTYEAGTVRVQRANTPFGPVTASPNGVELAILLADRRAPLGLAAPADTAANRWQQDLATTVRDLAASLLAAA